MTLDLSLYEKKIFSQFGEDGATSHLVDLIYTTPQYFVEFGVGNGDECNTRILREQFQWKGLQMDGGHHNSTYNLQQERIDKDNIVSLFEKYNVPTHFNVLSIDIDGNDFYCAKQILRHYEVDIIIVEYNALHKPNEDKVIKYDPHFRWRNTMYFGSSLLAWDMLFKRKNYSLVYCTEKGLNAYFIKNEIIKKHNLNFNNCGNVIALYKPPTYNLHAPDDREYYSFEEAYKL